MLARLESPRDRQAATLAVRTATMFRDLIGAAVAGGDRHRRARAEQLAAASELHLPVSVREETVVPDADESTWKDVQEEASKKLDRTEREEPSSPAVRIVLPLERDLAVLESGQSTVRDGHSMRVPGQVLQDLSGSTKGTLRVDKPISPVERFQVGVERHWVRQALKLSHQLQLAPGVGPLESLEELSSVNPSQNPYWKEKAMAARHPSTPVGRETASRNHAMNMRVQLEVLTPRVQHGSYPDVCT